MSYALNEIEATAKKATRGAGYSWGMAEEAAKATRWLCAQGLDGSKALAEVLRAADQTKAGAGCPLMAGAALCDRADSWAGTGVRLGKVIVPAMLLPFAALAARHLGSVVTVEWHGVLASTDGQALCLGIAQEALLMQTAAGVTVRVGGQINHALPHHSRATPTDADRGTLNRFAHRIYAPASEESRLKGAGAGLSDND